MYLAVSHNPHLGCQIIPDNNFELKQFKHFDQVVFVKLRTGPVVQPFTPVASRPKVHVVYYQDDASRFSVHLIHLQEQRIENVRVNLVELCLVEGSFWSSESDLF